MPANLWKFILTLAAARLVSLLRRFKLFPKARVADTNPKIDGGPCPGSVISTCCGAPGWSSQERRRIRADANDRLRKKNGYAKPGWTERLLQHVGATSKPDIHGMLSSALTNALQLNRARL